MNFLHINEICDPHMSKWRHITISTQGDFERRRIENVNNLVGLWLIEEEICQLEVGDLLVILKGKCYYLY